MRAIGFNRRPDQIQCKTKKWKSLYVNVLRQRAKGKRVTCRYFKDLVEIFGDTSDKLGASAAAEAGDDIVEIELSHGAAVAANKRSDSEYNEQGFTNGERHWWDTVSSSRGPIIYWKLIFDS